MVVMGGSFRPEWGNCFGSAVTAEASQGTEVRLKNGAGGEKKKNWRKQANHKNGQRENERDSHATCV